jgi:hypothetical protein
MSRRCISEKSIFEANRPVTLDMPLANVLANPQRDWNKVAHGGKRVRIARKLDVDWKKYNQENFLFSHCSIVASVATEKNGYHILPACTPLVNNNGNAWTNDVLLATFRTFCGAENYLEHVQIPELSKGKIIDAVLRPVKYRDEKTGTTADIYYCDILVATNRRHDSLVRKIASGKLTTMSMGCLAHYVQCSKCGSVLGDNDQNCTCLGSSIMSTFRDENGVERIVAELCGRSVSKDGKTAGDPESVKFIEASWVEKPAFVGAVLNHYISELPQAAALANLSTPALEFKLEDLFAMRVADRRGMMVLNVARAELLRRRRIALVERVAGVYI